MKQYLTQLIIVIAIGASSLSFAAANKIKVQVNGMVCSFCSQGITKKFKAHPSIEDVKVSMEQKEVDLTLKEGKEISDSEITSLIKDAGVNVDKIVR